MSKGRRVALGLAGLLVVIGGLRVALPGIVRDAVLSAATEATGRAASLDELSLRLLGGRVELVGLALAGDDGPAVSVGELSLRLSWLGVLQGRFHLTSVSASELVVRLAAEEPLLRAESAPAEAPADAVPESDDSGWPILVEQIDLRAFRLALGDAPQVTNLDFDRLTLASVSIDADGVTLGAVGLKRPRFMSTASESGARDADADEVSEGFRFGTLVDRLSGARVAGIHLEEGDIVLVLPEGSIELALDFRVEFLALERGGKTRLSLAMGVVGGKVELEGRLVLDPMHFEGTLRWADVDLAALPPLLGEVRLRKGTSSAELAVDLSVGEGEEGETLQARVSGELAVLGAHIEAGATTTLVWESLLVTIQEILWRQIAGGAGAELVAGLEAVRVQAPDVRWSAASPSREAPQSVGAKPVDESAELSVEVAVDLFQVVGGRLQVEDSSVESAFVEEARFEASAAALHWPQRNAERLSVSVTGQDGESVAVSGQLRDGQGEISVDASSLGLARFDAYAARLGGVRIRDGRLAWRGGVMLGAEATRVDGELVLSDLDLVDTRGALDELLGIDVIGVPFNAAVVILRDGDGAITLPVEVSLDKGGTRVSVTAIVVNALRQAIVSSLTTPLSIVRFLAGLAFDDGAVSLPPIAFAPGSATLGSVAQDRLGALARQLEGRDDLRLELAGRASHSEVRHLRGGDPASTFEALGRQRAEAAVTFLIESLGVDSELLAIEASEEGAPGLRLTFRMG